MEMTKMDIQERFKKHIRNIENMFIVKVIKRKINNCFHPSIESLFQEFTTAEKPISREEYERCRKLINEYFGEPDSQYKTSSVDRRPI